MSTADEGAARSPTSTTTNTGPTTSTTRTITTIPMAEPRSTPESLGAKESPPGASPTGRGPDGESAARIGPAALLTARWALLVVGAGLALAQIGWPGLWGGQPAGGVWAPLVVIAVWAAVNFDAARKARRVGPVVGRADAGVHLLLDVALLTALLALTGGANNPFTMLYFLPITLATLVSRTWTWIVALGAVVGFAALVVVSTWTFHGAHPAESATAESATAEPATAEPATGEHVHDHAAHVQSGHAFREASDSVAQPSAHDEHYWRHLVGMGVALAVAGSLITYFVHKIAGLLAAQRDELERLRREAREDRFAASLGALSAGAAHELGTPLGTIQLLSGELEWMDPEERSEAVGLIRAQIERCKDILHSMRNPELSARSLEGEASWSLESLAQSLRAFELPSPARLEVRCSTEEQTLWHQPRAVIEQTVRELVTNACRAARDDRPSSIVITLSGRADELSIRVQDDGTGMSESELASAFEPFFSTREGGRGLGLFLARLHVRQLGGSLVLSSGSDSGTTAELCLPRHPPGYESPPQALASTLQGEVA